MSSFTGARSKANAKSEMIKANEINLCPINTSTITSTSPDTSAKNEKKKKSILPKIFGSKRNGRGSDEETLKSSSAEEGDGVTLNLENKIETRRKAFLEAAPIMRKSFSERETSPGIEGLNLSNFERPMMTMETELLRIFVAAWNVGGKSPSYDLNLQDFLLVEGSADIYVLGYEHPCNKVKKKKITNERRRRRSIPPLHLKI